MGILTYGIGVVSIAPATGYVRARRTFLPSVPCSMYAENICISGELGGMAGLLLGASVMTFCEFIDFFIYNCARKIRNRQRVRNHAVQAWKWWTPAVTWRFNEAVITSKRRHFDVISSKWRCFDVITTLLLSVQWEHAQLDKMPGVQAWTVDQLCRELKCTFAINLLLRRIFTLAW